MTGFAAVILAAGQGTRMKSSFPKVLHPVAGLPMILWSVQNARTLGADSIALVIGVGAEAVQQTVGDQVLYTVQQEQLGTGHATLQARELLQGRADSVLVLYGDMPTLRLETLQRLVQLHHERRPAVTLLSVLSDDSMGFGRVVRDPDGAVTAIVEEAVATPEILALKELNCGVYCFDADWLWRRLPDVPMTQPKGEYYLTDMVGLAVQDGLPVEVVTITDVTEVQGINNRVHLARAERIMRERIAESLMLDGVTLIDPATTYIEATVRVGRDTVIYPNTVLRGQTVVGEACELGPNSVIQDTTIGDNCRVFASVLEEATLENHVNIGPFGHLRPGAHLGEGVHMGNFGEVKNAYLAPGTKMGHFSYIGDARVGADANIAAGTVTCNFDGVRKHRTVIGEGAFIGSGTMLVAPVTVGKRAKIGAGSVVTRDVPDATLAYGVPARSQRKLEDEEESGG
ncbi:MAG: bifunctional UDP-N-acetylglucosamine diphosphorylase/glucosamine-1-phosphate N-acetyltransferase GlmU [Chloroflexi bacterium]|jgi:bifunctional UDP-N-acetylglucosamine pyrophosphorylase/glucosamine-1-phosphate N-acetyltransferase|nr:bifunctional UDP-N-acetylglucosamine diphosphorylase/glucosamine-1-phosphate N-acetyltransferase GlmU [Chloroflexota bacterium]